MAEDKLPKNWHGFLPYKYRNRKPGSQPHAPVDGKVHIVHHGNLTIVLFRDAAVVTRIWQQGGKTYKKRLKAYTPAWKKAVLYARTHALYTTPMKED